MKRAASLAVIVVVAAACASATYGLAASRPTSSTSLGAGRVSVPQCESDGFDVTHVLSGNNVASVTIASIASTCAGGALSVTVNNGTANSSGSGTVPGGGGSMTVALATAVAVKTAMQTDVVITGP